MSSTTVTEVHRPNPWFVGIVSGMASYIDACAIVSAGAAIVIYQAVMGFSDAQVGLASTTLTYGIAFGALLGGPISDRFGRKPVFSVTMLIIIVGSAMQVLAPSFTVLLVGCALVGLGTGADLPVSLSNIAEAATDENRGKIIGLSNILWFLGIVGAIVTASIVGNWGRLGGQILFSQVGIVALVVLVLRLPLPESPVWLKAQADKKAGIQTAQASKVSVTTLLKPPYLKPFLALMGFYSLVNIPANTGGQFTTWINVNIIGMDVAFSSRLGLMLMPLGFIWGFWFMKIVDTKWRMTYFYVGAALWVASFCIYIVFGFHVWTFIAVTIVSGIGGGFAFEGIIKVWMQERFPTLLRATAQGTILFVVRIVAGSAALLTPVLLRQSPRGAYGILASISVIGFIIAIAAFHGKQHSEFVTADAQEAA